MDYFRPFSTIFVHLIFLAAISVRFQSHFDKVAVK